MIVRFPDNVMGTFCGPAGFVTDDIVAEMVGGGWQDSSGAS